MLKLKAYVMIGLGMAVAVLYALFKREQGMRFKDKLKVAKASSDTLIRANDALYAAKLRGEERKRAKSDDRSDFE